MGALNPWGIDPTIPDLDPTKLCQKDWVRKMAGNFSDAIFLTPAWRVADVFRRGGLKTSGLTFYLGTGAAR